MKCHQGLSHWLYAKQDKSGTSITSVYRKNSGHNAMSMFPHCKSTIMVVFCKLLVLSVLVGRINL